jgi:hypothetical protein
VGCRAEWCAGHRLEDAHETTHGGGPASDFFSEGLSQHVLVEGEVGDQLLQAPVFVLDLPRAAELTDAQGAYFFFQR